MWSRASAAPRRSHPISITGTFKPVVLHFVPGDVEDDLIWYAPASHPTSCGTSTKRARPPRRPSASTVTSNRSSAVQPTRQRGHHLVPPGGVPPGGRSAPTPQSSRPLNINGRFQPLVDYFGCSDAHGPDNFVDVLWYAPGTAPESDLRWVADISESGGFDAKLYLAGIRDLHDHTLVRWSMGERQTTDLVVAALMVALARRNPTGELVHHADHSTQYTSVEFTNRLADWKLNGSYGSVGDCYDTAAMEALWAT